MVSWANGRPGGREKFLRGEKGGREEGPDGAAGRCDILMR